MQMHDTPITDMDLVQGIASPYPSGSGLARFARLSRLQKFVSGADAVDWCAKELDNETSLLASQLQDVRMRDIEELAASKDAGKQPASVLWDCAMVTAKAARPELAIKFIRLAINTPESSEDHVRALWTCACAVLYSCSAKGSGTLRGVPDLIAVTSQLSNRYSNVLRNADRVRLMALSGVLHVINKQYDEALRDLLAVLGEPIDRVDDLSLLLCARELTTYVVLLAVALLDRDSLRSRIMDKEQVYELLLLHSGGVEQAVCAMVECRFGDVLGVVAGAHMRLRVDPLVHDAAAGLYRLVHDNTVRQYCLPYERVLLSRVAEDVVSSVTAVETCVAQLVMDGKLRGTIDCEAGTFTASRPDSRVDAFTKFAAFVEEHGRNCRQSATGMAGF